MNLNFIEDKPIFSIINHFNKQRNDFTWKLIFQINVPQSNIPSLVVKLTFVFLWHFHFFLATAAFRLRVLSSVFLGWKEGETIR